MKKYERKTKEERRRVLLNETNKKGNYSKDGDNKTVILDINQATADRSTQNISRQIIAAILILAFALSSVLIGLNISIKAEGSDNVSANNSVPNMKPDDITGGGFVTSKKLSINDKGLYDLTLEAYSTGSSITEQIPTDIVLILDQSGSMRERDMPTAYDNGTTDNWTISQAEDEPDALYYKDGENYYRVYRKRGYMYEYFPSNELTPGDVIDASNFAWFSSRDATNKASSQWYIKDNNSFQNIKAYVSGDFLNYGCYFSYTNELGQTVNFTRPTYPDYLNAANGGRISRRDPSSGSWAERAAAVAYNTAWYDPISTVVTRLVNNNPNAYTWAQVELLGIETGMYINYPMYKRHIGYNQLCYKDANGEEHVVIDATYCDADGKPLGGAGGVEGDETNKTEAYWHEKLYSATQTTTRLEALNNALNSFVNTVAAQTNSDGTKPDHRIAIVGFSSNSSHYKNTELLTGTTLTIQDQNFETISGDGSAYYSLDGKNHNGIWHEDITTGDYANALLNVNIPEERAKIDKAIDSVTAYGGTEPYYGFQMAHSILNERDPNSLTYTKRDNTVGNRNQVIIFFTDGQPGNYASDNQYAYANQTILAASAIKADTSLNSLDGTIKTPIYSVGTFGEADANPLLYTKTLRRSDYSSGSTGDNDFLADRSAAKYDLDYVETLNETGITDHYSGIINRRITGVDVADSAVSNLRYRIWQNDRARFPSEASDTISDYMEVVTSKYMSATGFVDPSWYSDEDNSDNNNYTAMINRVRGDAEPGQYYYLSTNENALLRAFNEIFASVSSSVVETAIDQCSVQDVLSNNIEKTGTTAVKLYKSSGYVGEDGTASGWGTPVESPEGVNYVWNNDKKLNVNGFDFSEEFIAENHPGNKLIIKITDLNPTENGDYLESNTADIGVYANEVDTPYATFPRPSFSRHSYSLNVGTDNPAATFNYATKLVGNGGNLDDVIVVIPETVTDGGSTTTVEHRFRYADFIADNATGSFGNWGNGTVFYYENVPADYTIHTSLTTEDDAYTYYVAYDDDQAGTQPREMTTGQATARDDFSFDDHQINITSEANTLNAYLTLMTQGTYANTERQFSIGMEITKGGTSFTGDVTYKLNGSSSLTTLRFSGGTLMNPDDLKLKHGDRIEFTNLPAGSNVTLTPSDDPGNVYTWEIDNDATTSTDQNHKNGLIDQSDYTFAVVYTRSEVTDTGVLDDTNTMHPVLFVLAGIATFVTSATGYYCSYRKRRGQ